MALTDIGGGLWWGVPFFGLAGIPQESNILNDAAGEAWAFNVQVPKTGTITKVLFRTGTVTTAQNMTVTLETVGADGLPTGSPYGFSTGATWAPANTDDNVTVELTLGTSATATVGDLVALRGEWSGSAGNLNISYITGTNSTSQGFPKVLPDTGAGFGLGTDGIPKIAFGYNDGSYAVPKYCYPPGTLTAVSTNSSTSPQEVGVWINSPVALTVDGIWVPGRTIGTTETNTVALYTTPSGTPSSQRSFAPNHNQISCTNDGMAFFFNPYDITASTDYVIGFLQSSTDNYNLYYYDVSSANHWGGFAGGSALTYASRNSGGGAFTQTTTRKLFASVSVSKIHDGAGGGGIQRHPGMAGGLVA